MNFISNYNSHAAASVVYRRRNIVLRELVFPWRHLLANQKCGTFWRSSSSAGAGANATVDDAAISISATLSVEVEVHANALASASSSGTFSNSDDGCSAANTSAASGSPVSPAFPVPGASLAEQAEWRHTREFHKLYKQTRQEEQNREARVSPCSSVRDNLFFLQKVSVRLHQQLAGEPDSERPSSCHHFVNLKQGKASMHCCGC